MLRSHLIAFCLALIGAYGVLYAIHSGRVAAEPIYDLESRLNENESKVGELEDEIERVKSTISDLEYQRY